MDKLPEELQVRVLEYLDAHPPSEVKARQEPNLNLALSKQRPLKNASCLSKRWRRIALPLLFRHACVRIDTSVKQDWLTCCLHSETSLKFADLRSSPQQNVDQYHIDLLRASPRTAADMEVTPSLWLRTSRSANSADAYEHDSKVSAARIYHASKDFLDFITGNRLQKHVASLVLLSDSMKMGKVEQLPSPIQYDWRYEASASMWQHILSVLDPERLVITAPPMELACFCNAFITLSSANPEIAWAFTDMDYHIVELRQNKSSPQSQQTQLLPYVQLQPIPDCSVQQDIAPSSVLNLREWTSISLNEGSFLKAYGTYEYFEHGPPSLISSIANRFGPRSFLSEGFYPTSSLRSLRSFTYTAIFPFANHLDFLDMLPRLETLDLQFAPDPQSGILDNKERTGRAELQDCWQELISGYHDIASTISTFRMSRESFPRLKTFICRDIKIPALKDDLDHIFTPLCLPVWAEYEDGVFTRIADKAELPGTDDII